MGAQAPPGVVSAVPGCECGRLVRGTRGALPERWSQIDRTAAKLTTRCPDPRHLLRPQHQTEPDQWVGQGCNVKAGRAAQPEIAKTPAGLILEHCPISRSKLAACWPRSTPPNECTMERQQRCALRHSAAFASTSCATASASVPDACRAPRTVFIFSTLVSITNREVRLNARPTCLGVAHSSAGRTSP